MLNAEQVVETLHPLMTPERIARIERVRRRQQATVHCSCQHATVMHTAYCCIKHLTDAGVLGTATVAQLCRPDADSLSLPVAPAVPLPCPLQVCASRTFNVLPICENIYDLGNLAAVCRSADGEQG